MCVPFILYVSYSLAVAAVDMVALDMGVNLLCLEVERGGSLRKRLGAKIAAASFLSLGQRVTGKVCVEIELEAVLLNPSRVIFECACAY